MSWLKWAQRNFKTYPWKPEGCALRPFTEDEVKALGDVDGAEAEPNGRGGSILKWKYWSGSRQVTNTRGANPHGEGRLHVDRDAIVRDVPFWAVKWLVFERDKKCQDCGVFGWESRREWHPKPGSEFFSSSKTIYEKPITQAVVDAYNIEMAEYSKQFSKPSAVKDWYRYADPDYPNGLEVHHIVAVVDGGSNCCHNLMLLCWKCHKARKGKGGLPSGRESKQSRLQELSA